MYKFHVKKKVELGSVSAKCYPFTYALVMMIKLFDSTVIQFSLWVRDFYSLVIGKPL